MHSPSVITLTLGFTYCNSSSYNSHIPNTLQNPTPSITWNSWCSRGARRATYCLCLHLPWPNPVHLLSLWNFRKASTGANPPLQGFIFSSVQFSSVAQSCLTLCDPMNQHARVPCPSPTPGVHSNSCPSSHKGPAKTPCRGQAQIFKEGIFVALSAHSQDCKCFQFSSVQFSHSVVSDSLQPHELQHARPPCCC